MSKCDMGRNDRRRTNDGMTFRQVFRMVLCEVLNEPRNKIDDFIEPLASVTPWLQSVDLDSPAPHGLLKRMRSQPMDVLGWVVEARIRLTTDKSSGIVLGRRCRETGRLIVDHVIAI